MKRYVLLASLLALALTACEGNRSSQDLLPAQPAIPTSSAESASIDASVVSTTSTIVTAHVTVRVPAAATAAQSISVAVNGAAPTVANLSASSTGCVAASATQPLTCTIAVAAPAATDIFAIKTYNGTGGAGTVLAAATVLQPVSATTVTTIPLTLSGTVAALSVRLGRTSATECAPTVTAPIYVRAKDSLGNIIVSANYGTTITLHDSDGSGATAISTTSLTGSSSSVAMTYNGHKVGRSVTISAAASGLPASAIFSLIQQLYVLDANNQYITVFSHSATGNVAPLRILNERGRMTAQAREIAVSRGCVLYAADGGNNTIFAFPADGSGLVAPIAAIAGSATMLNGPQGIATDSTGRIFAPVYNSTLKLGGIGMWNSGTTGNVAPAATIMGSSTQVAHPASLAFDGSGNLYVLDFRKVIVFAKGATGNATPLRVLLTPSLYCETGMNVDAAGNIYVTDCSNTLNVYAAGSSGSAAPVRVINTGASTGPTGVATDYGGNEYTALQRIPAIASYASSATGAATPLTKIAGTSTTLNFPFDVAF